MYDGGVLSPAVLERLLVTFAAAKPDWDTEPTERSVDGRSLHEVVALTMLPGESLRAARKSFMSVIQHVAGATRTEKASRASRKTGEVEQEKDEPAEDDESAELAEQLTGSTRGAPSSRKRGAAKANKPDTSAERPARTAGFNPLVNATAPRKSRS
nr:hypothetical protein [Paraburkholderia phenoliruptrix]